MRNYFFATTNQNIVNVFCNKVAYFYLLADLPLTGRPCLSQGGQASYREASYREAGPLTGSQGLLQGGMASDREARPLTGRPDL